MYLLSAAGVVLLLVLCIGGYLAWVRSTSNR